MRICADEVTASSCRLPIRNVRCTLASGEPMDRTTSPLVLLVDDFDDAREMYAEYLAFKGWHVITAASGEEAITLAQRHQPAIILMDLEMRRTNGTDAMRTLRKDPAFAAVPIIAFTAHA